MLKPPLFGSDHSLDIFLKDTLISGQPAQIKCVEIAGQCYVLSGGFLKTVQLEDEWYEDVANPEHVIETLHQNTHIKADFFTFWQRVPDLQPCYSYHQEQINLAVQAISSFDVWWNSGIKKRTRRAIRKSEAMGVEVREGTFDDEFVRGMTGVFNETLVRQGRPFFHYGKDFETVKRQFARFNYREEMIGAYFEGEMIGFMMLGIADRFADIIQLVSYLKHRDKKPNNALIAKAVGICEKKGLPYLAYGEWTDDSLSDFKRHCGFQKTAVPRYYIPLTLKGKLVLALRLHKGWKKLLPRSLVVKLKQLKKVWYLKKAGKG